MHLGAHVQLAATIRSSMQVADPWPVVTYWNAASAVKLWLFYLSSIAIPPIASATLSLVDADTSTSILTLGCGPVRL